MASVSDDDKKGKSKKSRMNGFEEWGGYMAAKKKKLKEQFEKRKPLEQSEGVSTSNIFAGISIFVNGYTNPSSDELKRLMMIHGGRYDHYYSLKHTTHIIASNLPDSKIKSLRDEKVVTPNWIMDSIAAGKLLPYKDYLLYTPEVTEKQQRLNLKSDASKEKFSVTNNHDVVMESIQGPEHSNPSPFEQSTSKENQNVLKTSPPNSCLNLSNETVSLVTSDSCALKAGHPDFISEFYNHSRLHHISTAGQELKKYVQQLAAQQKGKPCVGREKLVKLRDEREYEQFMPLKTPCIMHLDMDCFFVSVGLRKYPELCGQPVAVTHSKGRKPVPSADSSVEYEMQYYQKRRSEKLEKLGLTDAEALSDDSEQAINNESEVPKQSKDFGSMSEIASCSYEARQAGLRNGMLMGEALRLCPNLKTIPYDFEAYSTVSRQLYDSVASYTLDIEAVSCDELYIECTDLLNEVKISPAMFAKVLREEIAKSTGCTASAGIGSNMLLARLATRVSKPNGQYIVHKSDVQDFMKNQRVKDLPGVGYATASRLKQCGIHSCEDLQKWTIAKCQEEFGMKIGQSLYDHCRGKSDKTVTLEKERKSVSAEINYGIRFEQEKQIYDFIKELAVEVQQRLRNIDRKGRSLTLKLRIRKGDAPKETAKFMGHGVCDSISKSIALKTATNDAAIIGSECCAIAKSLKISPSDYRGIGIQMAKLEPSMSEPGKTRTLEHFIAKSGPSKENSEPNRPHQINIVKETTSLLPDSNACQSVGSHIINTDIGGKLDLSVLNALPEDLRNEVLSTCSAKLPPSSSHIAQKKTSKSPTKKDRSKSKKGKPQKGSPQKLLQDCFKNMVAPKQAEAITVQTTAGVPKANLGGAVTMNDVRSMIKEWVQTTKEGPIGEDTDHFKDYLLQLIDEDLPKTDLVLKYFHRLASDAGELWRETYLLILSYVQQKMLQNFGYMLKAESSFND